MLRVEGVSVVLGGRRVLHEVDLTVDAGETVALLGPSGHGKSTLLRAVAGLEPLETGRISYAGDDLAGVPPHRRGFGFMFQDGALFPHRDVQGNVEFGLRMAGMRATERDARVEEVLALVGLTGLGKRHVSKLSGGEQQRVALARTLAPRPRLIMLDEPLGSLDRLLHDRLVDDLRTLLRAAHLPALVVTHDHDEAAALADRVALVRDGKIVQHGSLSQIASAPRDDWVASFLGLDTSEQDRYGPGGTGGAGGACDGPGGPPGS
jgi:thiamine transport system ATP-binding protein